MSIDQQAVREAIGVIEDEGIDLRPHVKQWLAERAVEEFGYVPTSDTPDSGNNALMLDLVDEAYKRDAQA
jgi:hypothetical protein